MVFSSLFFLFLFLPIFLAAYYATPERYRNATALAGSLIFYAWGAPRFVFALIALSAADYYLSLGIHRASSPDRRRLFLSLGVALNAVTLLYFKYANFFVDQVQAAISALGLEPLAWTRVVLPIGISFFTFQKVSYLVDVYRGTAPVARSARDHLLYVILFPQLIAGPIVRYHDVARQILRRDHTPERFHSGIWRFGIGLGKKALVANPLGALADAAFAAQGLASTEAWLGLLAYAFQIYFDFSGYSDMAIGLGRMVGFEFMENFDRPYRARDFMDFWRRWHISLSSWMREYLYVPLGGNRKGAARTYLNLWLVFLFSGFWHGASWSFVLWGAYHGLFISLHKAAKDRKLPELPGVLAIPLNFLLVCLGWVLFRAETLPAALAYYRALFAFDAGPLVQVRPDAQAWTIFAVAMAAVFLPGRHLDRLSPGAGFVWLRFATAMVLLILSAAALANSGFNPFIYFRF